MFHRKYRPLILCRGCQHMTRRLLCSTNLLAPCPRCGSPNVSIVRARAEQEDATRFHISLPMSTIRVIRASGLSVSRAIRQSLQRAIARGEL